MTRAAREAYDEIEVRPSGAVLPILSTRSFGGDGTLGQGLADSSRGPSVLHLAGQ
jgi:hypothetical protein